MNTTLLDSANQACELSQKYLSLALRQDSKGNVERLLVLSSKYHSIYTSTLSDYIMSKSSDDLPIFED